MWRHKQFKCRNKNKTSGKFHAVSIWSPTSEHQHVLRRQSQAGVSIWHPNNFMLNANGFVVFKIKNLAKIFSEDVDPVRSTNIIFQPERNYVSLCLDETNEYVSSVRKIINRMTRHEMQTQAF
jgi:hypothetical protein